MSDSKKKAKAAKGDPAAAYRKSGTAGGKGVFDWLRFEMREDHLVTGEGLSRREVYFVRFWPHNMEILDLHERLLEEEKWQTVLQTTDIAPSVLIMDKTEGLDEVRANYERRIEERPALAYINEEILAQLEGIDESSACVERAFYFVCRVRRTEEFQRFYTLAKDHLSVSLARREELMVLLRNFLLREYATTPLATWDEEVRLKYAAQTGKLSDRQRRRAGDSDEALRAFAYQETLRELLPNRLDFDTRYTVQNGALRQTVTVRSYPREIPEDRILHALGKLPGTTVRMYLEPIASGRMTDLFQKQINHRSSLTKSARKKSEQVRSAAEEEQVIASYRRALERDERMYFLTILVEVYGDTEEELRERLDDVRSTLSAGGFSTDELRGEQREAFLSVLPYGVNHVDTFKRNMTTRTIAGLYPFTASRRVDPQGYLIGATAAGSPIIWDNWRFVNGVTNAHILIVGTSGMGKSYLIKKALSMSVARGIHAFALDSEGEYRDVFRGLGGETINCAGGGVKINPFQVRRNVLPEVEALLEPDEAASMAEKGTEFEAGSPLMQHLSWLAEFHRLLLPMLDERLQQVLSLLVQEHYAAFGICEAFEPDGVPPAAYPTYSTLYQFIDGLYERCRTGETLEGVLKVVREDDLAQLLLALYSVYAGAESRIFNGATNVRDADLINFDIQSLHEGLASTRNAVLFNITSYVWSRVMRKEPTLFLLDELQLLLHPIIVARLNSMVRRGRKYEAALVTATQDLETYEDPQVRHLVKPLFTIPMHRFYFNMGATQQVVLKDLLDLSDSETDILRKCGRQQCLFKCGEEKYALNVGSLDYEEELFGSGGGQ